jgi:hypothetical protein
MQTISLLFLTTHYKHARLQAHPQSLAIHDVDVQVLARLYLWKMGPSRASHHVQNSRPHPYDFNL